MDLPSASQREKLRLAWDCSGRILNFILLGVPAIRVCWNAGATGGRRDSRGGIQLQLGA
jgi:hypothetical protein